VANVTATVKSKRRTFDMALLYTNLPEGFQPEWISEGQRRQLLLASLLQRRRRVNTPSWLIRWWSIGFRGRHLDTEPAALPPDVRKGSAFPDRCPFHFGGYASRSSEA